MAQTPADISAPVISIPPCGWANCRPITSPVCRTWSSQSGWRPRSSSRPSENVEIRDSTCPTVSGSVVMARTRPAAEPLVQQGGADRVQPTGQALGSDHRVGLDLIALEGPYRPGPPQPRLHL